MSEAHAAQEYRYWAFITYSHKDEARAKWLHRAIETYGIPANLVEHGHTTPAGEPAPKRFQPIFRDRDELPASADLSDAIEDALAASRYLIVICSPNAAQSKWVNREVETFVKSDRSDRVFAFIVDGEPNSGDKGECFPPALRPPLEPLAADARPQGDGRGDAKLKLLAGMLGVSFDALKRRDDQRRIRRWELITAVALVLVVAFAGLALYANQQRVKAVKARQQAESVLEFLLYDLRDALEPVGRLDIIEKVEQRVDEYYRQLGVDPNDPRTLKNWSSAAVRAGDFALAKGDLGQALAEYRASLVIAERLAGPDASNAGWQRDLSVSHERVGDVLQAQGDLTGALAEYRAGLAIREQLAGSDPSNGEWQRDLWVKCCKVADAMERSGDPAATVYWQRAFHTLSAMKQAGMDLSPSDEQFYQQLRQKLGR